MQPLLSQVHIDAILTNMSLKYHNSAYVAERMFPTISVNKKTDKYFTFPKGAWFRNEARPRGAGGLAPRGGYVVSNDSYDAVEYAFAHPIPVQIINNADAPLNPFQTGVRYVTNKILLAKEILASTLMSTAANWTNSEDAAGGWTGAVGTATTIEDIIKGKEAIRKLIGRYPNVLMMNATAFAAVKQDMEIVERIKYTGTSGKPADVTTQTLAALFELDEVIVGGAIYSDAEEVVDGSDFNAVDLFETNATKGAALLYYRGTPAIEEPMAAAFFNWKGWADAANQFVNQNIFRGVRKYFEEAANQWVVEAMECFDLKVIGADCGYLFYDTALT